MIDQAWAKRNPTKVLESFDDIVFKPADEVEANEEQITKHLKSLGYM